MNGLFTGVFILICSVASFYKLYVVEPSPVSNFKAGEELIYDLRYGIIHGGYANISLRETEFESEPAFHARAYARSVGITDKLFKVEDVYESYFNPVTCWPFKSIRNIREGGYRFYNEVVFAHSDSLVYSQKSGEIAVPPGILDIESSLYFLRQMNLDTLQNGDVIDIITFFGDEVFPFPLRYRGTEIVKTKIGKFNCHRFDPVVEVGRIFESEDDMTMWISADKNRVPIRVRFDMIVGGVMCDLVEYKNLCHVLMPIE